MSQPRQRRVFAVTTPEGTKYVRSLTNNERKEYFRRMEKAAETKKTDAFIELDQVLIALALSTEQGFPFGTFEECFEEVGEWETSIDGATKLCATIVAELSGIALVAAKGDAKPVSADEEVEDRAKK
jgi:hypothetical protein